MRKAVLVSLIVVCAVLALVSIVSARSPYLTDVNTVCGTNYNCSLCHPNGTTSQLNQNADTYAASGACAFCPNDADCGGGCTDRDGDSYATEGGNCGPVDCDDNNPLINPGVQERSRRCSDGIDNNCNGLIDCQDPSCAKVRGCKPPR